MTTSDINSVISIFQNSFHHDNVQRSQAEAQLNEVRNIWLFQLSFINIVTFLYKLCQKSGFPTLLIQVISEHNIDLSIKQAASIYFKNWVKSSWDKSEIFDQDKQNIRTQLLPAIAMTPTQIQSQLMVVLSIILFQDFPEKWPNYLQLVESYLHKVDDSASLYCGLLGLSEFVRVNRWKSSEKRLVLVQVIQRNFSSLNQIGQKLISANFNDLNAGIMLKTIVKTYFMAIQFEMPLCLQSDDSLISWCDLLVKVMEKPVPSEMNQRDQEDLHVHPWFKLKKWAFRVVSKIFCKYGNPSLDTLQDSSYKPFAKKFVQQYAPAFLKVILAQIERYNNGEKVTNRILSIILSFLNDAVKSKVTWAIMKPQYEHLVAKFVFPLMCISEEDLESWEDDPQEFIQKKMNFYEDLNSPSSAAQTFLVDLVSGRFKVTFFPVLQFINSVLSNPTDSRHYYGAMSMLSCISGSILSKKSSVKSQVGSVLSQFIVPQLNSDKPFLRMKACQVLLSFCDADDAEQLVLDGVGNDAPTSWLPVFEQSIVLMQRQQSLPVRVYAALLLERLISRQGLQKLLSTHVARMMEATLQLSQDIHLEILTVVMETVVEVFPAEVAPFSVQLCAQLRDSFIRLVSEIKAADGNEDPEKIDPFADGEPDKLLAAMGLIKTICTLILSVQTSNSNTKSPKKLPSDPAKRQKQLDLLAQIENEAIPCVLYAMQNSSVEMYDDIFELIDCLQYQQERISPAMWQVFELLCSKLNEFEFDYIEEMFPILDNFISYGSDVVCSRQEVQNKFLEFGSALLNQSDNTSDKLYGFKIYESMLMHCRGHLDALIPDFLKTAFGKMGNESPTVLNIHCIELIINCIWYNPLMTLSVLMQANKAQEFFEFWSQASPKMVRVHDKKLSIVSLLSLFKDSASQWSQISQMHSQYPQLMKLLMDFFGTLDKAIEERKELERMYGAGDSSDDDDDEEDDDEYEDEDELVDDDQDVPEDGDDAEYLQYLNQRSNELQQYQNYVAEEEDDWMDEMSEELFFESPLDKVNVYALFRDTMAQISSANAEVYKFLTSSFTQADNELANIIVSKASAEPSPAA